MNDTTNHDNVMDQFFTSDKAEEGVKLFLEDNLGNRTDQWIRIRGENSEEFRVAELGAKRDAVAVSHIADYVERDRRAIALARKTAAALVLDWSFPMPCTPENVEAFFKKAPQIQRAVDIAASDRRLFYKVESTSSTPTSAQSTPST